MASDIGNGVGMLGTGASKPPAFRRIVNLYKSDLPFRSLIDFAVIGAAVMLFLHPPSSDLWSSLKFSRLADFFGRSADSQPDTSRQARNTSGPGVINTVQPGPNANVQPGPQGNVQPGSNTNVQPGPNAGGSSAPPKGAPLDFDQEITRPALQNVMIVEFDDAIFRSSAPADQPKLVSAARAYRARRYDDITGLLKDARDSDPNVAFLRGMALGNSTNVENRKLAMQNFQAAANAGHQIASILVGRLLIVGFDGATKNVELGRQMIEKVAAAGNRLAQRAAAIAYINGEFGAFDPVKARSLFAQAANAGDPQAMLHYSNMLFNGIAGPRDPAAGEDYLRRAAAAGLTSAQYTLGNWLIAQYKAETLADPKEGVEWLERAYTIGHATGALVNLSAFYANTGRTPPWNSKDKYFEVIQKCSAINNQNCQFNTALAYHFGWGTKRDLVRAYAHYQVAKNLGAERALSNSQSIEGEMTASERNTAVELARHLQSSLKPQPPIWFMQYAGVEPPASPWTPATYVIPSTGQNQGASGSSGPAISFGFDMVKSTGVLYRWFDIDAANFESAQPASKTRLVAAARAYREGRPSSDILDALKGADAADPNVAYMRAVAFYVAKGGSSADDNKQAKDLLTEAVRAGHKDAQTLLGMFLIYTVAGSQSDPIEGRRLLDAGVQRNDRHALRQLAILLTNGQLGNPDYNLAAQYMKRAADAGDPVAALFMASYHEKGIGVPKDIRVAENYIRQSARLGLTHAQSVLGEWLTRLYRTNQGGNPEEGVRWLDRAFQGKNFDALFNAILLYADAPKGSEWRNHRKALDMSRGCIEFKASRCHSYVGFLLDTGEGVNHDPMKAYAHYDIARALGNTNMKNLERAEKRLTASELAAARDLSQALQTRLKPLPDAMTFQPPVAN